MLCHVYNYVNNMLSIFQDGYSEVLVTGREPYHVGRLEVGILVEGWTPEAPLEDLDDVENEARPDLHQRAVLFNDLQHRATINIHLHTSYREG